MTNQIIISAPKHWLLYQRWQRENRDRERKCPFFEQLRQTRSLRKSFMSSGAHSLLLQGGDSHCYHRKMTSEIQSNGNLPETGSSWGVKARMQPRLVRRLSPGFCCWEEKLTWLRKKPSPKANITLLEKTALKQYGKKSEQIRGHYALSFLFLQILVQRKKQCIQYRRTCAHPGFITNSSIFSLPLAGVHLRVWRRSPSKSSQV